MRIKYSAQCDQGLVRASNEDSYVANGENAIFLVADGMGGHAAGEVASRITASVVEEVMARREPEINPEDLLQLAVQNANKRVYDTQEEKPECRGMGSTLTVLTFMEDRYYIAQVGNSRAYLFRENSGLFHAIFVSARVESITAMH